LSNALKATRVSFAYNGKDAVALVSVSIERGEFVSFIGPNGSGKTTLLRLFSGVLAPRTGRVEIFGRDVRSVGRREMARIVAVVPQETATVFPFTVEEIVLMGRFPHLGPYGFEGDSDVAAARDAMRVTDTLEFADRHIQDLSGGERQRVIVARALAQEAEVLLLDEPTAFLDIKHQAEIAALVKSLSAERGLTVVMASHDLNLASALSHRLVLLKSGSVFAEGPSDDVIREDVLSRAYETEVSIVKVEGRPHVAPRLWTYAKRNGEGK